MENRKQAVPTYGEKLLSTLDASYFDNCGVICAQEAWDLVKDEFPATPVVVMVPETMEQSLLEAQIRRAPGGVKTWFGIGGGSACDAAKMAVWLLGGRLILMPSIVSVDAAFTAAVGVRVDHHVRYVGMVYPDYLLIDFDLLRRSPKRLNIAGIGDILSIFTALPDWLLGRDVTGEKYSDRMAAESAALLARLMAGAVEIRDCTNLGLKLISDLYYAEVALCDAHGNSRPEEGSEHYFAYCLESLTHRPYIHGELISMAVVLTGIYQGQDVEPVVRFLDQAGVCWRPDQVEVTRAQIVATLLALPEYLKGETHLPYGIYHHVPTTQERVDDLLVKFYSYV